MKKPLWSFFKILTKRTPVVLAIDQYQYFYEAFLQLPTNHFRELEDLRDFSKIFWLKDYEFERDYNRIFQKEVGDKLIAIAESLEEKIEEPLTDIKTTGSTPKITDTDVNLPKTDKNPDDEKLDKNPEAKTEEIEEKDFFDFELVISEKGGAQQNAPTTAFDFENLFTLTDQSIMPFQLRYFAQRLRRAVETPFKEFTDELDYPTMIEQYSKGRYIEEIVYQYRDSSRSNVILLSDRQGSMLSYEYIDTHLVNSIKAMSDCHFEQYYFYNLPKEKEDSPHYLLKSRESKKLYFDTTKNSWDRNSWFFILSDAGGQSGMLNKGRMRATLKMWNYFKKISNHVYWINPVPPRFRKKTTAERLNFVIPMIYPLQGNLNQFFNKL